MTGAAALLTDPMSATLVAVVVSTLLLGAYKWTRTPSIHPDAELPPVPQDDENKPCIVSSDEEAAAAEEEDFVPDSPLPPLDPNDAPASDAFRTVHGPLSATDGSEETDGTMGFATGEDLQNGCGPAPSNEFSVRGKDYLKDKKKYKSVEPMFDLVGCDSYYAEGRDPHVSGWKHSVLQRMQRNAELRGRKCPRALVVNWMVPGSPPINHVQYFVEKEFVAVDDDDRMWQRMIDHFMAEGNDAFRTARFKLIPKVVVGPWLVKRAVGKPALVCKAIKTEYTVGDNYLEIAIDIGCSTVAEKICSRSCSVAKSLVIDMAYTIEGKKEEELPERLLAAMRIHHFDMKNLAPRPQ